MKTIDPRAVALFVRFVRENADNFAADDPLLARVLTAYVAQYRRLDRDAIRDNLRAALMDSESVA